MILESALNLTHEEKLIIQAVCNLFQDSLVRLKTGKAFVLEGNEPHFIYGIEDLQEKIEDEFIRYQEIYDDPLLLNELSQTEVDSFVGMINTWIEPLSELAGAMIIMGLLSKLNTYLSGYQTLEFINSN